MEALTQQQKKAVDELVTKLHGVAHALVDEVDGARARQTASPAGITRLLIDPLLDVVITTDPLRREIDLSLSLGLRYIINNRYKFLLNIRRSGFSELTFTLRPVIGIEVPAIR